MRRDAVEVRERIFIFYNNRYTYRSFRSEPHVNIEIVDYFTKLVIRPVNRANSGQYTVSAVNSSGKDTATINVTVTDKPTPPIGPLQVRGTIFAISIRLYIYACFE